MKRHPNLQIQVAHLAGQPEDLVNLGRWLDTYPNLIVDFSSAKWMAREFSYKVEETQEFFKTYQDKLLFGTDIVTGRSDREPIPGYYYLRYLSMQALLETDVQNLSLPLADPDNNNETVINGLNLPMNILRKIYWDNAAKFFGEK
ncbi:MAG: amidohydrolase family protein [Candidatus Heimdallarchaeota archaeon]